MYNRSCIRRTERKEKVDFVAAGRIVIIGCSVLDPRDKAIGSGFWHGSLLN